MLAKWCLCFLILCLMNSSPTWLSANQFQILLHLWVLGVRTAASFEGPWFISSNWALVDGSDHSGEGSALASLALLWGSSSRGPGLYSCWETLDPTSTLDYKGSKSHGSCEGCYCPLREIMNTWVTGVPKRLQYCISRSLGRTVEDWVEGCWTPGWLRRVHTIVPSNSETSLSLGPLHLLHHWPSHS